ncbi:MAG TPA: nidogen-like domain-containing protein [Thiohalobacter sp.]|nr:nidogen-like domain-containing protein [Thiohalobacter sp.]
MKKQLIAAATAAGLTLMATTGQAVPIPPGSYYTDVIGGGIGDVAVMTGGGSSPGIGDPTGRNDDGFRGPILLGFNLDYFGSTYSSFYANNNGNISFGSGISAYTPDPLNTTSEAPSIAPYWADVDTRGAGSGVMHVRTMTDQIIVTWDGVGYYSSHDDKLAYFQLVLRSSNYLIPPDEGQIGFFFKTVDWETGDASGGSGGFGGTEATVGFGDGLAAVNTGEISLAGSQQPGISNVVENNHYWFLLGEGGTPEQPPVEAVPAPATLALMGIAALGMGAARRRRSPSA